jgi:hypothetical protein
MTNEPRTQAVMAPEEAERMAEADAAAKEAAIEAADAEQTARTYTNPGAIAANLARERARAEDELQVVQANYDRANEERAARRAQTP